MVEYCYICGSPADDSVRVGRQRYPICNSWDCDSAHEQDEKDAYYERQEMYDREREEQRRWG